MLRRCLGLVCALVISTASFGAWAQNDADRAAAQAFFDEGQAFMKDDNFEEACKKFEASRALDAAAGTTLNLANCYEKLGRTASAWVNYLEASQADTDDKRRAAFAKAQAERLKPKLMRIKIVVEDPVDGMVVNRGKEELSSKVWGNAMPVDPGEYAIVARAPGYEAWQAEVSAAEEGEVVEVVIPALQAKPEDTPPDPVPTPDPKPDVDGADGSGQRIAGFALIGVAGASVIVGGVLAGMAHGKASESEDFCLPENPDQCIQQGVDLREEAQGLQIGYAVSFVAAGALLGAGIVTLVTAPSGGSAEAVDEADASAFRVTPILAPGYSGASVDWAF